MDGGTPFNIAAFVEDVLTGSVSSDPLQLTSPSQSLVMHQPHQQQPSSSSSSSSSSFYTQPQPTQNQNQNQNQNQMYLYRQGGAVHPRQQHVGTPTYQGHNINTAHVQQGPHFGTQSAPTFYPQVQGPTHPYPPPPPPPPPPPHNPNASSINPNISNNTNPSTIAPPNITNTLTAAATHPVLKRAWDQSQILVSHQLGEIHAAYERRVDEVRAHAAAQVRHAVSVAAARVEEAQRGCGGVRRGVCGEEKVKEAKEAKEKEREREEEKGRMRAWLAHAQRENTILKTGVSALRDAKDQAEHGMHAAQTQVEHLRGENARLGNKVKELEERVGRMEDEWRVAASIRLKLYAENKRLVRELKEAEEGFGGALVYPDFGDLGSGLLPRSLSATPGEEEARFEDSRLEERHGDALEHVDSLDPLRSQATVATTDPLAAKDALEKATHLQHLEDQDTVEAHGPLEYPESADPYLPLLRRFSGDGRTPCPHTGA